LGGGQYHILVLEGIGAGDLVAQAGSAHAHAAPSKVEWVIQLPTLLRIWGTYLCSVAYLRSTWYSGKPGMSLCSYLNLI
jgi:hypothetical protein